MSKAFFLLTDTHLNISKESRFNYGEECLAVIDFIASLVDKYKWMDFDEINAISLGDLDDMGHKDREKYGFVQQLTKKMVSLFDFFYLNFGNHEITYPKNNPVYSFISNIQHPQIRSMFPFLICESLLNEIQTPERIVMGNVEIVFRGYKTTSRPITGKPAIILMHDLVLSEDGLEEYRSVHEYNEQAYELESFSNVTDIYCGHAHTIVEDWVHNGINIHNLGSLLRTSVKEITDYKRVRKIPVLIFDDNDNLVSTKVEEVVLHERATIVDETVVESNKTKYEIAQESKRIQRISSLPDIDVEDPVQAAREIIVTAQNSLLLDIFEKLADGQIPIPNR